MKLKLKELKIESFVTKEKDVKGGVCTLGSGCNFTLPHCSQAPTLCFS